MNIRMYDSRIAVPWTYWLALASGVAGIIGVVCRAPCHRESSPLSGGTSVRLSGKAVVRWVASCLDPAPPPPLGRIIDCSARDSVEPASPRSNVSVAARELWGQARRCGNLATPPRPWLVTVYRQATTPPPPGGRVRQRRHHPLLELVQGIPTSRSPAPVFQLYLCRVHLIVLLLLYLLFSHERDGYSTRLADRETEIEKDPRIEDSRLPVPPLFTRRGISSVPWWEI